MSHDDGERVPGHPGPGRGGPSEFVSGPAEKRSAARAIEHHLEPDTRRAGDHADAETSAAVRAFGPKDGQGWATSGALKAAHHRWGEQVAALLNRLGSEKAALRDTNALFDRTDTGVAAGLRRPSSLDLL
ncbi:hypothetical protein ACIQU5_35400 [Streptomyces sp. NPDC090306]|uniref:hypothetical protein n=1 Tax=unclassified Streptomyces TaxID=2593676 RepID=UPI0036DFA633